MRSNSKANFFKFTNFLTSLKCNEYSLTLHHICNNTEETQRMKLPQSHTFSPVLEIATGKDINL